MIKYNFDEVIDRRGTHAVKLDGMQEIWGRTDLIPLWVADMDFATPPFILEAVRKRCEHPILGYTEKPDGYYQAVINWLKTRYDMNVSKEHLNYVPGIVAGLGMAINCFTSPGDKIMIMPPVYHPFAWLVKRNNRQLVECPLILAVCYGFGEGTEQFSDFYGSQQNVQYAWCSSLSYHYI